VTARAPAPGAAAVLCRTPPRRLLAIERLEVRLGGTPVLHGVEAHLHAGELLAVVGPNGAGKSTLLRAAAGLERPAGGEVRWDGRALRDLRPRELARLRAYLPQRPRVPPGLVVREAVAAGRAPHVRALRRPTARDRERVERALERAGVANLADRRLETLSGGELQRAFLALTLAQEAPVLLADEPTAHLDLGAQAEVATLLRELVDDGLALAWVLHDLDLACAIADRLLVLHAGRVVAEGAPAAIVTSALVSRVWGVRADVHLAGGRPRVAPCWSAAP